MPRGILHPNCRRTLLRRLTLLAFIVMLTFCTTACNSKPVEDVDPSTIPVTNNSKEVTSPLKPTSAEAIENKPTTPVETEASEQLGLEELLEKAPDIDGLTKFIIEDKIIYQNEIGEKAGYYLEKAYYNREITDGVVLSLEVIKEIVKVNQENEKFGSIALPISPSEGQVISVEFQQDSVYGGRYRKYGYVIIKSDDNLNITNSFYDSQKIMRINISENSGFTRDMAYEPCTDETELYPGSITRIPILQSGGFEIIAVASQFENVTSPYSRTFTPTLGESLGSTEGTILIHKLYKTNEDYDNYLLNETDILKINNSLVFVMQK